MYFAFVPLILLATPYGRGYPDVMWALGITTFLMGLTRQTTSLMFDRIYGPSGGLWRKLFYAGTLLSGGTWGAFAGLTVVLYGWSWTTFLIIMVTTSTAASAAASLSPSIRLTRVYLALMVMPAVTASFLRGGGRRE